MRRAELDSFLLNILDEFPTASDINFTVGKPPQVEVDGQIALNNPEQGSWTLGLNG